jgi:hypothetical protein
VNEKCSIDEFIKSLTRFSLTMSLFGVQQLANAFSPSRLNQPAGEAARATAAFAQITRATEEQFDEAIKSAFRAGDQLQAGMVDLIYSAFTFEAFTPRYATRLVFDTMQQLAEAFRLFTPGQEGRDVWLEFRNKLQAFTLFEYADGLLPPLAHRSLKEMVERAAALEPFRSVWAMEGVGHYYAESVWARNETPSHLLTGEDARTLPGRSLIPLHAGMGLSLANRVLATIKPDSSASEMRQALLWFFALCDSNAKGGYAGTVYESLGLVARNLYPQMVTGIDRQLAEANEEMAAYFWHGVGRAIYFAPTNFAPCIISGQRAMAAAWQEPPHALARRNALAGLAWAITLVNIRQPQILEMFLRRAVHQGFDDDAFANGVSCAMIVWRDAAPDDPGLHAFCRHLPPASDPAMVALWNRLVAEPCERALRHYDTIKARGSFGELFHYQSMLQATR